MGGPSLHGQRNKAHKSGNKGASARQKHRLAKEGGAKPAAKGASYEGGRKERFLAAKHHREAKRQDLLAKRRQASSAPLVVALLPLSEDVNVGKLWQDLISACQQPITSTVSLQAADANGIDGDVAMLGQSEATATNNVPQDIRITTLAVAGRSKARFTLLPPPNMRNDPLAVVELAKTAEVVLLAISGNADAQAIDAQGTMALSVLRAMGLPDVSIAVQCNASSTHNMKERAAAKKRAEKALSTVLPGEQKILCADNATDCSQLVRHLVERPAPSLPAWRQDRSAVLVEDAEFQAGHPTETTVAGGLLMLTGYIRGAGLSANQLLTVPGAGDFQIERIEVPCEQQQVMGVQSNKKGDMDMSLNQPVLLAQSDPELCEPLTRENMLGGKDAGDEEQTWPTAAEMDMFARRRIRKKVPEGTSEYQAAWLVDDEDEDDNEDVSEEADSEGMISGLQLADITEEPGEGDDTMGDIPDDDDAATDGMALDDEDEDEDEDVSAHGSRWERLQAEARARREAEGQDAQYPDEVDVPPGVAARQRFQKYRGLKSFRSSPWDVKEWLPEEYSKVFAFENFKRTHKRAKEAAQKAGCGTDPCSVQPGTWVRVVLRGVSADTGTAVVARVHGSMAVPGPQQQPALVCFGLMMHEAKMSVLHFGVTKVNTYTEPIASKEKLLLVTGVRSFAARPIYSSDTPGDKHKLERWLKPGQPTMASVYAPISYPPLPLLAFKEDALGGPPQLAATGALRTCNPDRIVLKKIVLTGYPVRVHKRRATVKYMFHNPDDVRWFRPVELYTRSGRRGRITEPLGTHGAMKALFDGPVQQREVVCMNLYKRVYPKWPEDSSLKFA